MVVAGGETTEVFKLGKLQLTVVMLHFLVIRNRIVAKREEGDSNERDEENQRRDVECAVTDAEPRIIANFFGCLWFELDRRQTVDPSIAARNKNPLATCHVPGLVFVFNGFRAPCGVLLPFDLL